VSFASEPGQDDGSLPPANIEIPDDARDLARDVIAYHRELRAKRRRERMARVLRSFARVGFIRHGIIFPVIATCVALSLIIGAILSVRPVSLDSSPGIGSTAPTTRLPQDTVKLDGGVVSVSSLAPSVLVLIPPTCGCGPVLSGIAKQAARAHVDVYFVYAAGNAITAPQATILTADYGDGVARTVYDSSEVLFTRYAAASPVALVVARDGTVVVQRTFPQGFDLSPALRPLERTH
jgi:hypothetical protein